jgi:hypothetical protein
MTEACCEIHRKIINSELPVTYAQLEVMDKDLYHRLIELELNEDREDRE